MSIYNSYSDFNKYRVFYAVAECLSFSKATEYLHISQPAISHAINELEEQLDIKLFKRENKKISLTEEGEQLLSATSAKKCRLKWLAVVMDSSMILTYTSPSIHAKKCKK